MVGLPATTICVTEVRRKPQERATVRISVLMALTMACCSSLGEAAGRVGDAVHDVGAGEPLRVGE